jgi:hypothetical protein
LEAVFSVGSATKLYIVQLIILWIGRIEALSYITADMWSHEMVLRPFSLPSKKQLCACGVFRKKIIVVKGRCLHEAENENVSLSNGKM